jgi:TolB protein
MKKVMLFLVVSVIIKADLTSFPICENPLAQYTPAIDGGLVVWVDDRKGTGYADIYAKLLPGGTELELCIESGIQSNPAVSGSLIVWQDGRKNNINDNDIYGYDVNTGQSINICSDSANQQYPDVSGRIVVWEEYNGSNWDIYAINLDGGSKFVVCDNAADQLYPAISGNYVVWQDYRNGGTSGYDIYCRDLTAPAGSEFLICGASGDQFYPDIDGQLIVWQDPRNAGTDYDIYGYDLGGGGEFPVCVYAERQNQPMVSGNWIVWRDRRNGTTNYDIYGYNRQTQTVTDICTVAGHQNTPAVSAQYVVWQGPVGSGNIEGAAFPVQASITVISPNGGQTWIAGSQQRIQWQSQGAVSTVKIEISSSNGTNWQTIANNIANAGSYEVVIGGEINSSNCLIRVSDSANPLIADQSDAVFTIFKCTLTADLTGDCFVGLEDFTLFAEQWLVCGNPFDPTWCQNN